MDEDPKHVEAPVATVTSTTTETVKAAKLPNTESQIVGVSIRGWLAVMLLGTVCALALWGKEAGEPLRSSALLALGFYFGQKQTTK
jgi:hypothetical protein